MTQTQFWNCPLWLDKYAVQNYNPICISVGTNFISGSVLFVQLFTLIELAIYLILFYHLHTHDKHVKGTIYILGH